RRGEESSGRTGGPLFLPPQVGGNPDAVNRLVGFYLRGILQIRYRIETNAERLQRRENLDRAAEHSRQELGNILQWPSVRSDLRNPVLGKRHCRKWAARHRRGHRGPGPGLLVRTVDR